jgi:phosphoribosyl 1,2-cyclic phosphate phosphodiesterase
VEVWVVGCLGPKPHPTHAHVDKVIEWARRLQPKQTWLTHMSHMLDYGEMEDMLPDGLNAAYDGLAVSVSKDLPN